MKHSIISGRVIIFYLILTIQIQKINGQQFQYFGIQEYSSRSIGMGLTGLIDAYSPLSVFRNPALNRTGKKIMIKPFYEWIGNGRWDEVNLIPQQINGVSGTSSPETVSTDPGLTSSYWGGVIQGSGVTIGYIHSDRKEFLFRDVGLFESAQKFYGRHVKSDLLYAGYTLKLGGKGRMGVLLKNFQSIDTGIKNTLASTVVSRDDIDIFLDEKGSPKETTAGIDFGGLYGISIIGKPVTVGFSILNAFSTDSSEGGLPVYLNAGIAIVPIRNLLLELNAVDISDEDGMFSETGIRAGIEYSMRGLRIRSGLSGDKVSFGLGVGGEGLSIDYGVIEVDHTDVAKRNAKERFQSLQISLSGGFY